MLDRVAKQDRVATIETADGDRRFVGVFVVLDIGERHPFRLKGVAELSVQQLDRDVVA